MKQQEKQQIREALRLYVGRYPSQNKAAASLKDVSVATVSNILAGKDATITSEVWKKLAAQLGVVADGWKVVDTSAYTEITTAMADAQTLRNVMWIVGEAGCGKTTAAKQYAADHRNVYYILCSEDMKRGDFIKEVARVVGIKAQGFTIGQTWQCILHELVQREHQLLIFDEADKLTDNVFSYFVSLYNKVEEHAGIIFLSTEYICKRISLGLQNEKKGYKELFSRIGRKFYHLEAADTADVAAICRANGIDDEEEIRRVLKECATDVMAYKHKGDRLQGVEAEYDFRRVKKSVQRTLLLRRHYATANTAAR